MAAEDADAMAWGTGADCAERAGAGLTGRWRGAAWGAEAALGCDGMKGALDADGAGCPIGWDWMGAPVWATLPETIVVSPSAGPEASPSWMRVP